MSAREPTPSIAVCSRSFSAHPVLRAELLARYPDARFNEAGVALEGEALVAFLRGADGAIVGLERLDAATLRQLPDLRVVSKFGVGLDRIDLDALERHGIRLGWRGGVNRRAVAEVTLAFALSLLRGLHLSDRQVRSGSFRAIVGRELGQSTFGIVGFGHIGTEVARLLAPFGARILACDIRDRTEACARLGAESRSLDALLAESDVVSLHVPLDASTRGLIDRSRLALLREGACLINTARGGLVDELALAEALADGRLGGAAFDVFEAEPPVGSPLLQLPRFIASAHLAGSSVQAIEAMGRAAIEGLA